MLGRDDLAADPRFAANSARVAHRVELVEVLEQALRTAPAGNWQAGLTAAGVPAGQPATIAEGLDFAASLGLEPVIEVKNPAGEPAGLQVRQPISWTPAPPVRRQAPPALGAHDESVRGWLAAAWTRAE